MYFRSFFVISLVKKKIPSDFLRAFLLQMSFDLDLGVAKNFCRNHTPHKISSERNDLTFGPKKKNCWQVGFSDRARLVISFSQMSSYEMNRLKSRNSSTYQLVMEIWSPETKLKCWKCTGNFDKISFFFSHRAWLR